MAFFLKQLIRYFPQHSKGCKWMVDQLLQLKQPFTQDDLPQMLATDDKIFLGKIFTENFSPPKRDKKRNLFYQSVTSNNPQHKRKLKFHSFKTQPDIGIDLDAAPFTKTSAQKLFTPINDGKNNATVYYDVESK